MNVESIDSALPRARSAARFRGDPFRWLCRWRKRLGDVFVIDDGGSILARSVDCAGSVAVFGAAHHREVLNDIERFRSPISAAQQFGLPYALRNLNAGLHSMAGERHARQKQVLGRLLAQVLAPGSLELVDAIVASHANAWRRRAEIPLAESMRELTLDVATALLFGATQADRSLAATLIAYFHLRRAATFSAQGTDAAVRAELTKLGVVADRQLRAWYRKANKRNAGVLAQLADTDLTEDEFVAHANVVFVSCYAPVAMSLTWILLVLSQRSDLRAALRGRQDRTDAPGATRHRLRDRVIDETLRLLTPNALMVRVTSAPTHLAGCSVPRGCEIVLCPFLSHREPNVFARPEVFLPQRWLQPRPSPYDYFPMGAGGHACVGRTLALGLIGAALDSLLRRTDIVLARDQAIDWHIHILLTPRDDPMVKLRRLAQASEASGTMSGELLQLLDLRG